jgi:hypothetical protein
MISQMGRARSISRMEVYTQVNSLTVSSMVKADINSQRSNKNIKASGLKTRLRVKVLKK